MKYLLWAIIILGILHLPITLEWVFWIPGYIPLAAVALSALNIVTTIALIPVAWRMK